MYGAVRAFVGRQLNTGYKFTRHIYFNTSSHPAELDGLTVDCNFKAISVWLSDFAFRSELYSTAKNFIVPTFISTAYRKQISKSGSSTTMDPNIRRLRNLPNIVVVGDDSKRQGEISELLKSIVANDRYTIYAIGWNELADEGWTDQTTLVVVSGKSPNPSKHIPILLQFLGGGGSLFSWGCESPPFGPTETEVSAGSETNKVILNYGTSQTQPVSVLKPLWVPGKESKLPSEFPGILETSGTNGNSTASVYAQVEGSDGIAIIIYNGGALGGRAVLSRVSFQEDKDKESSLALLTNLLSQNLGIDCTRNKDPEYTCGYLLGNDLKIKNFLAGVSPEIKQRDVTIEFVPEGSEGTKPSPERLPVKSSPNQSPANFSTSDYFNNLTTKELGQLVIYTDLISSTMNIFQGKSLKHGLVVIANRQSRGKGRGNNIWLSPEGCACFTIQVNVAADSVLGKRIPLIQLIAAMSVVSAIPNHKEISLCTKWPNDIYIGRQKVGGVLVEGRLDGNTSVVSIGIGVNVSNDHPTLCLNSVLVEGDKLTPAILVAKVLSQMEGLLEEIEKDGGLSRVLSTYKDNWLQVVQGNDDGVVRVELSGGNYVECRVVGIDEFGFLRVIDIKSGEVHSVNPDGNSFDIASKLIAIKTGAS